MELIYREFTAEDVTKAIALWQSCEGIGLTASDGPERIETYLERNPGLSFAAWDGSFLVGAVLGGHDGRRGFLHHLAVHRDYRRRGIGHELVKRCHDALHTEGIEKIHIFVYQDNQAALDFWKRQQYFPRDELVLLSVVLE